MSLKHAKCLDFFLPRQRDIQPEVEKKNQSCKITKLTKQKPTKIHKNTRPREAKKRKKSAKKIFAFSHRQSVTWLARKVSKAFNVRSYRWGKISGHRRDLNQLFFKHTKKLISLRAIPTFLDRQIKFFFRSLLNQVINTAESWTVRELECALNNCYKVEVQQRDKPRASEPQTNYKLFRVHISPNFRVITHISRLISFKTLEKLINEL